VWRFTGVFEYLLLLLGSFLEEIRTSNLKVSNCCHKTHGPQCLRVTDSEQAPPSRSRSFKSQRAGNEHEPANEFCSSEEVRLPMRDGPDACSELTTTGEADTRNFASAQVKVEQGLGCASLLHFCKNQSSNGITMMIGIEWWNSANSCRSTFKVARVGVGMFQQSCRGKEEARRA
jgi:hypothetical protein